jgi:hypothetical protein
MARAVLPNFSKGEIGPNLYGRIDTPQYAAGLKLARNFLVQKYGGVTFRPGTKLVGEWDDSENDLRLVPFQFSIEQAYVLTMGQGFMRPAALGGFVIEQNTKITAITLGNPTTLTIPFHGYAVGDRIYLYGIEGTVELNGRTVNVLTAPDASTVTVDIDSTGFAAFVSSDGTLNAGPPPTPPTPPVVPPVVDPPSDPDITIPGYDPPWWKLPEYETFV